MKGSQLEEERKWTKPKKCPRSNVGGKEFRQENFQKAKVKLSTDKEL